jgi:hypothetical protein
LSLSETMLLGRLWSLTTSLKNIFATCIASLVFYHGIKCHLRKSIHHKKYGIKYSLCPWQSHHKIHASSQGLSGIGNGWYNPMFYIFLFACWKIMHLFMNCITSVLIPGQ